MTPWRAFALRPLACTAFLLLHKAAPALASWSGRDGLDHSRDPVLGSLFSGDNQHFVGPGILDLVLLAVVVYLGYRFFLSRRGGGPKKPDRRDGSPGDAPRKPSQPPNGSDDQGDSPRPPAPEHPQWRRPADRFEAAQQMWDRLGAGQQPASQSPPGAAHSGLDKEELLRGAKVVYVRMRDAMGKKNLEEVQNFATQQAMEQMSRRMETPAGSPVEILLVDAEVRDVDETDELTRVDVRFDALVREPHEEESSQVREVWSFVRRGPKDHWRLEAMEQGPEPTPSARTSSQ